MNTKPTTEVVTTALLNVKARIGENSQIVTSAQMSRADRVFIRNSRHSPPPKEAVLDAMEAFFMCLAQESHAGVSAVLGHYFFVYIHPYMDGNGRLARFLMNVFMAAGGYPWTVVRVDNRREYISTLEATHTHSEFSMSTFTKFIVAEMQASVGITK